MPPSIDAVFFWTASSTRREASRDAARIRSCRVSTSSGSTAAFSIATARTSLVPDIVILTMPPPDVASIFIAASSSWSFDCMAWACCIIFWMFMAEVRLLLFLHLGQLPVKELHRGAHHRVRLRAAARALAGDRGARHLAGGLAEIAVGRRPGLQHDPHWTAEGLARDLGQELLRGGILERLLGRGLVDAEAQHEVVPLGADRLGEARLRRRHHAPR